MLGVARPRVEWDSLLTMLWLNLFDSAELAGLVMCCAITNSSFMKLCFHELTKRHGRHRTLVTDLADDISHVCNFVSQDSWLPHNREEFNHAMMPAHCLWHKSVILDASSVPTVPSHTSTQRGTRNTSANAHSPLGRLRTDFDFDYQVTVI